MTEEKLERAKAFTKKYQKYQKISLARSMLCFTGILSALIMWLVLKHSSSDTAGIIAMIVSVICAIGFFTTLIWSLIIRTQLKKELINEENENI